MPSRKKKSLTFKLGIEALGRVRKDIPPCYVCPICLVPFPEEQINFLTWEHVPPESLGGRKLVLTCRPCNFFGGGPNGSDTHARRAENILDFKYGVRSEPLHANLTLQSLRLNVQITNKPDGMNIFFLPKNNPPDAAVELAHFTENAEELIFNITPYKDAYSPGRQRISWLRAAYLAAFAALGYRYILRSVLDSVRDQIQKPDSTIPRSFKLELSDRSANEYWLCTVSEPKWVQGLAIRMGRHLVFLPVFDDDYSFYGRLEGHSVQNLVLQGKGTLMPWPKRASFALDFVEPHG